MKNEKKIINLILTLATLSGAGIWLVTQQSPHWVLPIPAALEARRALDDALFVCNNVRTTYIKNPWGDLGISSSTASISRDHIVRASSITMLLKQLNNTPVSAKAELATLTPKTKMLTLTGKVNIEHTQGLIQADEAMLDIDKQTLSFTGNVLSEIGLSPAHKQPL